MNNCIENINKIYLPNFSAYAFGSAIMVPTSCPFPDGSVIGLKIYCKKDNFFNLDDDGSAFEYLSLHGVRNLKNKSRNAEIIANLFSVGFNKKENKFFLEDISSEQLFAAICYLSNCVQSFSTQELTKHIEEVEETLKEKLITEIRRIIPEKNLKYDYQIKGYSNKNHKFDVAFSKEEEVFLFNPIVPHHASISTNFVKFSDVRKSFTQSQKFKINGVRSSNDNWQNEDIMLINEVADNFYSVENFSIPIAC